MERAGTDVDWGTVSAAVVPVVSVVGPVTDTVVVVVGSTLVLGADVVVVVDVVVVAVFPSDPAGDGRSVKIRISGTVPTTSPTTRPMSWKMCVTRRLEKTPKSPTKKINTAAPARRTVSSWSLPRATT
jgi:hypothetical protein